MIRVFLAIRFWLILAHLFVGAVSVLLFFVLFPSWLAFCQLAGALGVWIAAYSLLLGENPYGWYIEETE